MWPTEGVVQQQWHYNLYSNWSQALVSLAQRLETGSLASSEGNKVLIALLNLLINTISSCRHSVEMTHGGITHGYLTYHLLAWHNKEVTKRNHWRNQAFWKDLAADDGGGWTKQCFQVALLLQSFLHLNASFIESSQVMMSSMLWTALRQAWTDGGDFIGQYNVYFYKWIYVLQGQE